MSSVADSFSGRSRRATRRRVHAADRAASAVIRVGGVMVLVAVLGICVFLVAVVVPLFRGGRLAPLSSGAIEPSVGRTAVMLDEYAAFALMLDDEGTLRFVRLDAPETVARRSLAERSPTAWSFDEASGLAALAFEDGTLQLASISFTPAVVSPGDLPEALRRVPVGSRVVWPATGSGADSVWPALVEPLSVEQVRVIRPEVQVREPVRSIHGSGAIRLIDYRRRGDREFLALVRADGGATFDLVRTIRPLGGGTPRVRLQSRPFALHIPPGQGLPRRLFVTGDGTSVLALWDDGLVQRYAADGEAVVLAEEQRLLSPGRRVTTARMLLGGLTLAVGDDAGVVTTAFTTADPAADAPDSRRLVVAGRFEVGDASIRAIGLTSRSRTIAIADDVGRVTVLHTTSGKVLGRVETTGPILAAAIAPKLDALAAFSSGGGVTVWTIEPGHPEASLRALFGRVHYEGEPGPVFRYQSSSGEDASESKYSLVPLIHGTLKATLFAMLFAAPLAILAAIYTSEFLDRRVRALVKPGVEMMASLPSVVLGFVAAIAVAPFVRDHLLAALLALFTIPLAVLLGAHLWQLAPPYVTGRVPPRVKLLAMVGTIAGGIALAAAAAAPLEHALFGPTRADRWVMGDSFEEVPKAQYPDWIGSRDALSPAQERRLRLEGLYFREGRVVRPVPPSTPEQAHQIEERVAQLAHARPSLRRWLDGNYGSPWPGWLLLLSPVALITVIIVHALYFKRRWDGVLASRPWILAGALELLRLICIVAISIALAAGLGLVLTALSLDTRDVVFGTFNQRNTLVVALIMGFAIIPIIYTISEDAMRAVPDTLRSASLGAGATPWQTAVRVVLPVAGSGIFSACMIGLGRAVGETMIVLMATGNTPAMDWNIFSGFRTLSANIAVELPEAPVGSTHYRVLFLCGLVLFAMTFVVNSVAEIVRQRFRARSKAL